MKVSSISAIAVALIISTGCSGDKGTGGPPPSGDAIYDVTFTALWSEGTHADGFPGNPHFSPLVGGTHNSSVTFGEQGGLATLGIKNMAELGVTSALEAEVTTAVDDGTAEHGLVGSGISPSPGNVSLSLAVTAEFPLVTLVSMLAPSPDWFVGVSGLSLWQGGAWAETLTVDLYLYDAGTDGGTNYTSANAPTDPHVAIMRITGYPALVADEVPPIGTFTITRL